MDKQARLAQFVNEPPGSPEAKSITTSAEEGTFHRALYHPSVHSPTSLSSHKEPEYFPFR
jgi:hypothetical protein